MRLAQAVLKKNTLAIFLKFLHVIKETSQNNKLQLRKIAGIFELLVNIYTITKILRRIRYILLIRNVLYSILCSCTSCGLITCQSPKFHVSNHSNTSIIVTRPNARYVFRVVHLLLSSTADRTRISKCYYRPKCHSPVLNSLKPSGTYIYHVLL
jgi:hypothetical protein